MNKTLNGYRADSSSQIPSNLEKGTGEDLTALIFGDFSTVMIGLWRAIDLVVDPHTLGLSGGIRLTAMLDCDIQFRNAESLAKVMDKTRYQPGDKTGCGPRKHLS